MRNLREPMYAELRDGFTRLIYATRVDAGLVADAQRERGVRVEQPDVWTVDIYGPLNGHELRMVSTADADAYWCAECGHGGPIAAPSLGEPCEGPGNNASERRFSALGRVFNRYYPLPESKLVHMRAEIAEQIEDLQRYGRTARWKNAVAGWARMVRDEDNTMHWALGQGSIYTGHEAR